MSCRGVDKIVTAANRLAKTKKELLEAADHFSFGDVHISKIDNFFIIYKGCLVYNKDAKSIISEYNIHGVPESERFYELYEAIKVVKRLIK